MNISFRFTDHATHESVEVSEGFARLGNHDVFAYGRSYGVAYGDMDPSRLFGQSVSYAVTAQRLKNGEPAGRPADMSGSVPHGTMEIRHWATGAYEGLEYTGMWETWQADGTEFLPDSVLTKARSLGPNPDPEKTEATGSGRLFAHRCPYSGSVIASDGHSAQDPAEADRWVEEQAKRACSYYDSRNNYLPYIADPKHYIGAGYSGTGGQFNTLYSQSLPEGISWTKGGWAVPHATHLTVDGLLAAGYLFGDYMALRMAVHTVQAVFTTMMAGEKMSSRAYGRFAKTLAEMAPLISMSFPGSGNLKAMLSMTLQTMKMRNQGGAPAPDNGSTSEGGHLTGAKVFSVLGPLGYDLATCQEIGRSDNVWMCCQLVTGLLAVEQLWGAYGILDAATSTALEEQLALADKWVLLCGQPMYNLDGGIPQTPGPNTYRYYDDKSTYPMLYGLGDGGGGSNFAVGVGARFILGTLAELDLVGGVETMNSSWVDGDLIYQECRQQNNFNGDYGDWMVEALPVIRVTGWDPPLT